MCRSTLDAITLVEAWGLEASGGRDSGTVLPASQRKKLVSLRPRTMAPWPSTALTGLPCPTSPIAVKPPPFDAKPHDVCACVWELRDFAVREGTGKDP